MRTDCPSEMELIQFVDHDLPPETLSQLGFHLVRCPHCREQEQALRRTIADLAAPPPASLDVDAHVRNVLSRIDQPAPRRGFPRVAWLVGAGSLAAGLCLFAASAAQNDGASSGLQARGGAISDPLARDVSVEPYVVSGSAFHVLADDSVEQAANLTASVRNLGNKPMYLLVFIIDAGGQVHWISPSYTRADEDPTGTRLAPRQDERLLETVVSFDDLAVGPARIVSIVDVTATPVSAIERLSQEQLTLSSLRQRFPGAALRETRVVVRPRAPRSKAPSVERTDVGDFR